MKNKARNHSPMIVNNEIVHVHLCDECAERHGEHEQPNGLDDKIQHLLEGLIRSKNGSSSSTADLKCERCGTTAREYRKHHLLGCAECYELFAKHILKDAEESKMVFTRENRSDGFANHLIFLSNELKKAVEAEHFERAAELRDKIQQYEKRSVSGDNRGDSPE